MELLTVVGSGLSWLQVAAGGAKRVSWSLMGPDFFPLGLFTPFLIYIKSYSPFSTQFVNLLDEIHSRKRIYVAILGHSFSLSRRIFFFLKNNLPVKGHLFIQCAPVQACGSQRTSWRSHFFLLPCGSRGLNSGCSGVGEAPLPDMSYLANMKKVFQKYFSWQQLYILTMYSMLVWNMCIMEGLNGAN